MNTNTNENINMTDISDSLYYIHSYIDQTILDKFKTITEKLKAYNFDDDVEYLFKNVVLYYKDEEYPTDKLVITRSKDVFRVAYTANQTLSFEYINRGSCNTSGVQDSYMDLMLLFKAESISFLVIAPKVMTTIKIDF